MVDPVVATVGFPSGVRASLDRPAPAVNYFATTFFAPVSSAWSELRWVEGGSGSKVSKVVSLSGGKVRAYVLTDAALARFVWQDASTATKGAQVPEPPPDDADLW